MLFDRPLPIAKTEGYLLLFVKTDPTRQHCCLLFKTIYDILLKTIKTPWQLVLPIAEKVK